MTEFTYEDVVRTKNYWIKKLNWYSIKDLVECSSEETLIHITLRNPNNSIPEYVFLINENNEVTDICIPIVVDIGSITAL